MGHFVYYGLYYDRKRGRYLPRYIFISDLQGPERKRRNLKRKRTRQTQRKQRLTDPSFKKHNTQYNYEQKNFR